jgi:hypothetical protein
MNESISILEAIIIGGVTLFGWVLVKTIFQHIKNK